MRDETPLSLHVLGGLGYYFALKLFGFDRWELLLPALVCFPLLKAPFSNEEGGHVVYTV